MENLWTKEQTTDAILQARKIFGDASTSMEKYNAMEKGLGLAYLYCPENMRDTVEGMLHEATVRRFYFEVRWAGKRNGK